MPRLVAPFCKLNVAVIAERIRQQDALKGVVLVALTGYGQDTDRQRSQEAGFDHHLVKPSDFDEIEKILANASEKRSHVHAQYKTNPAVTLQKA